jgi:heterodisulfide reductase subunit A
MAVASRVATFVGKGEIKVSPEVARVIPEKCDGCAICLRVCPVAAIEKSHDSVIIDSVSCIGCGVCLPKCPKEAIDLDNSTEDQLIAQIHSLSQDGMTPRIITFLEKEIAYGSADLAGQSRASYPANVKSIRVPSTGRVGLKHLLHAFAYGADGVILLEDHGGVFTEEALREHTNQLKKQLSVYNIEPMRLMSYSTTLPEYNKVVKVFETFNNRISKMGLVKENVRKNLMEKIVQHRKD